jgi:hypothetical protein
MALIHNYTPFFKFKTNEVSALSVLNPTLTSEITPFFDLPRKDGITREGFEKNAASCAKKANKYLSAFPYIFVDSFDIPDTIAPPGSPNCNVIIQAFSGFNYVPVLGLDRAPDHNSAILSAKASGKILSKTVAVRLQQDEFSDFNLVDDEIADLINVAQEQFTDVIVIFDCRVCINSIQSKLSAEIANFSFAVNSIFKINKFIVVGSSIPSSITDIAKPNDESIILRKELSIFHGAQALIKEIALSLGDYTIVSPTYSDLTLPKELLLSVTAPKVFYAFENYHYIARGGRIKTGGYGQYDDICVDIVGKAYFRKSPYSWGDGFIQQRANGIRLNNITPSTILKPTICAHIEYMARDYPK